MDDRIKHMIESGLMESYLLGTCSEAEEQEIDALLESSEELRAYFETLEDVQYELTEAVKKQPPESLRSEVKASIESLKNYKTPVKSKPSGFNGLTLLALFLFMLSLFACLQLFIKNIELQRELMQTKDLLNQHSNFRMQLDDRLNVVEENLFVIKHPATNKILLNGNSDNEDLKLVAFWNDEEKTSLLSVERLPGLPDNQCYQLWVDVDGKMIDLGVIKDAVNMVALDYYDNAESLNVTIEPEGGSEHPTVSRLVTSVLF